LKLPFQFNRATFKQDLHIVIHTAVVDLLFNSIELMIEMSTLLYGLSLVQEQKFLVLIHHPGKNSTFLKESYISIEAFDLPARTTI
jgi:hypothetical protein